MLRVEHEEHSQHTTLMPSRGFDLEEPELTLYTRYEHGNVPVRVFRNSEGQTTYEVSCPSEATSSGVRVVRHESARSLMRSIYGTDNHMPFDRYFKLGRYRRAGRASGQADLLTLLGDDHGATRRTDVVVHEQAKISFDHPKATTVVIDPAPAEGAGPAPVEAASRVGVEVKGGEPSLDPEVEAFMEAMGEEMLPQSAFVRATPEMREAFDKAFTLELDRLEGVVGIDLGAKSERAGATWKADEVRKLLWRGFAGKMLSQGYDPEDVLQEVYRGLLVRNRGKCPWDGRKSTFGHYVHMVISCVLTNYHRKQVRRIDKDAVSLTRQKADGEEVGDIGQFGSCSIEHGSEVGDQLAVEGLARWLAELDEEAPEAVLGRQILPMVAAGHQRGEIVRETGERPSLVSRALAWLRRQTAAWAAAGGHEDRVPAKYRMA